MKIIQIAFILVSIVLTSCTQSKYALKEIKTGNKYEISNDVEPLTLADNKIPDSVKEEKIVEGSQVYSKIIEKAPVVKAQPKEDVFAKTDKIIKKELKQKAKTISNSVEKNKNTAQVNMASWGKKLITALILAVSGYVILILGSFIGAILELFVLAVVAVILGILLLLAAVVFFILFIIGLLNEES